MMNGLHFFLWHYWDAIAYVGCVLLLMLGIAALWLCSKMVNVVWAARNCGAVLSYALLAFLPPGVLYFNSCTAQRIVERGPRSLEQHVVTLRRDALCRLLAGQTLPKNADALFVTLCEHVRKRSEKEKHALPLPQGIQGVKWNLLPAGSDLQNFFRENLYPKVLHHLSAQLDSTVTEKRAKQINEAIRHYLCEAAWQQNKNQLDDAAEPSWGVALLWGCFWLMWPMYQAYKDVKRIYPLDPSA